MMWWRDCYYHLGTRLATDYGFIAGSAALPEMNRAHLLSICRGICFSGLVLSFAGFVYSQQPVSPKEVAKAILEKHCLSCHGVSEMSGLDMRKRDSLLKGGHRGPAIVPGNAEQSLLYQAAAHQGELKMPPGSNAPLPLDELAVLKKWIDEGAAWPEEDRAGSTKRTEPSWWSFKKLRRPPVPSLASQSGPMNPVDAFVLVALHEKGLIPAPKADKRMLLRRIYFDLIGLPPTAA